MKGFFLNSWSSAVAWLVGGLLAVSVVQAEPAGSRLFDLQVDDLAGQPQSLSVYQGSPIVVNFWATWCPPCVEEMPDLNELSHRYPEVQFIGLAIDTQRNVKRFLEKIPVSYDLYVPGHSGVKHMRALGNTKGGLPFTLVIDADGMVQHRLLGQIDKMTLGNILEQLKN